MSCQAERLISLAGPDRLEDIHQDEKSSRVPGGEEADIPVPFPADGSRFRAADGTGPDQL